jgi:hypothetical protein
MADSSQVQVSYLLETSLGVIPNSAFQALRLTGGSNFGQTTSTVRSAEIRGDAQKAGTFRTDVAASPTLNVELSPGTFDDFVQALLRGTWSTPVNLAGTDISATASGFAASTTNLTTNVTVGQWVYVGGFANTAINNWYKVTAVTSTTMTTTPVPPATAAAGAAVTIRGSNVRNSNTERSFALQKRHLDLTNKYLLLRGNRIGSGSFTIQPGQLITGSFSTEALNAVTATSGAGNGSVTAVGATQVLNAVDNVFRIMIGGTEVTSLFVTQIQFNVNMNPRRQNAIGTLGARGIGMGAAEVTGSIEMFLDDNSWAQLSNYNNFTKQSLAFAVSVNGAGYVIEFPNIVFTNEPGTLDGNDVDPLLRFTFSAEPGTIGSSTSTIQVSRN